MKSTAITRASLLAMAALAGTGSMAIASIGYSPGNVPGSQRRSGPGWTNAHAKRIARKARNVKRHRATSRGKA